MGLLALVATATILVKQQSIWPRRPSSTGNGSQHTTSQGPLPLPLVAVPTQETSTPELAKIGALRAEAVQFLTRLMKRFPDSPDAIAVLAQAHYRFGDSAAALSCWQRCLGLAPDYADAYFKMAYIEMERGDYEKAEAHLRDLLNIAPGSPYVHVDLAETLIKQGRTDEAVRLLRKSLEIDRESADAFVLLGLMDLQSRDYQAARDNFASAIRIAPDYLDAYHGIAAAYARLGEEDRAREYREQWEVLKGNARQEDPGGLLRDLTSMQGVLVKICASAGDVYLAQGDEAEAERHWLRAVAVDPNDRSCRMSLASLYGQQGRIAEALRMVNELAECDSNDPRYAAMRGNLLSRLGDYDSAEKAFLQAIELDPDNAQYRRLLDMIRQRH